MVLSGHQDEFNTLNNKYNVKRWIYRMESISII